MEIRNYINILWRRKITVFMTLILTQVIVVIGSHQIVPVYESSTTLRVAVSAGGSMNYSDYMYADRLMNTYINIATSRPMLDELMERLDLSQPPEIQAEIISNTELIKIIVKYKDPIKAAKIANTLAEILITESNTLFVGGGKSLTKVLGEQLALIQADMEKTQQEYTSLLVQTPPAQESIDAAGQLLALKQNNYLDLLGQYEQARFQEEIRNSMITIFEDAVVPESPSQPRMVINLALGAILGLLGGLGLAFLFENLDNTLYKIEDIETVTNLPALVQIPNVNKRQVSNIQERSSILAEVFRNLATTIHITNHHQSKRVLVMISAEPSQGKSMIASHLTYSLAEIGKDVVAIDCDTRIPKLQNFFHLPNLIGLKDVLEQKVDLEDALQKSSFEGVHVLTSGSQLANPTQMLSSTQMAKIIKCLKQQSDYVILDTPAMLAASDVSVLVPLADVMIFVVRQGHAQRDAVQTASNFLAGLTGKDIILIVNQADNTIGHYSYYKNRNIKRSLLSFVKHIPEKVKRPT